MDSSSFSNASQAVFLGRFTFIACLVAVAVFLSLSTHLVLKMHEDELAITQFNSISDRALRESYRRLVKKGLGTRALSSTVEQMQPSSTPWPFVFVPGFEIMSGHVAAATNSWELALCPLVKSDQLDDFDAFLRQTHPDDEDLHSLRNLTAKDAEWTAPVLQYNEGVSYELMRSIHGHEYRQQAIDEIVACARERSTAEDPESHQCGYGSPLLKPLEDSGPASLFLYPIYPANNPKELVGFIESPILWMELLDDVFADEVKGIDCVITCGDQDYTFQVDEGEVRFVGEGDHHQFDHSHHVHSQLFEIDVFNPASADYILSIYPRDAFFLTYSTSNPVLAAFGSIVIIIFTSLMFFAYDTCVKREFSAKLELLEAKRKFVRFVSHEVRTPLNSVCMGLALVQEGMAKSMGFTSADSMRNHLDAPSERPDQGSESLQSSSLQSSVKGWFQVSDDILQAAETAVGVLTDLLNYDKIEMGNLQLEMGTVPIWKLVEQLSNEFKLPAARKKIKLTVKFEEQKMENHTSAPVYVVDSLNSVASEMACRQVIGDEIRISQVLRNLISNALKFTPENGSVSIRATWVRNDDFQLRHKSFHMKSGEEKSFSRSGHLRITVTDSGAGMSREQVAKLFRDGIQFNVNELQAGQGSGLGLFISKGIVEQHRGSLEASSKGLGRGTTFTLSLPLYVTDYLPETLCDSDEGGSLSTDERRELRVLVADDVASNRKLLSRLLAHHGHSCTQAANGEEALIEVERASDTGSPYDLLLLDFEMPIMNGPAAAKQIRSKGFTGLCIVGITGNMLAEDVSFFKQCGATEVLPKPFKMDLLDEVLRDVGLFQRRHDVELA